MSDFLDHLSASDKDLYDLLLSGKQRLTESVLLELARDRGIFYSGRESRDELADRISILPHDYHDIAGIVDKREPGRRREKTTSIRLAAEIPIEEIRAAVVAYQQEAGAMEKVVHHIKGSNGFKMQVEYDEFNHSRTRLLQRQRHDAGFEFIVENGETVVYLPATEKALRIANSIKDKIEGIRKETIREEKIELTALGKPEDRSVFFTRLISQLDGYKLKDVSNLKVSSQHSEEESDAEGSDLDLEDDENGEASRKMFAVVHSMALSGQNLVQSEEYQQLVKRGFFITAITWRAEQASSPYDIVQLDAGFQDRKNGTGFTYGVHGAYRFNKGNHRKTVDHVTDIERANLHALIESTARKVLAGLLAPGSPPADGAPESEESA